jgi:hypothetical protein
MRHNSFRNHSADCRQIALQSGFAPERNSFVRRLTMTLSLKTTAIGALTALALSAASATPAAAWCNGWGCGGGGWGGPGPAVAAGVLGGMALGAAAAGAAQGPYYGGPGYGGCWVERRPVYDAYGNYIGRRRVRVCE